MKARWMGVCARYIKDKDECKDVFQDATLKIFTDLNRLKEQDAFEGWTRKIIVNTALNHIKQRRSYLFALQTSAVNREPDFDRSDEQVLMRLDQEHLVNIINLLPEGYRTVFNLFTVDGYTHAEIAEMLDITQSSSRSQLSKAKRHLKDILDGLKEQSHEKVVGRRI